jgi:hypothetical protein
MLDSQQSETVGGSGPHRCGSYRRITPAHDWAIDVAESEAAGARFEVAGVGTASEQ